MNNKDMLRGLISISTLVCVLAIASVDVWAQQKSDTDQVRELEFKLMNAYKLRQVEVFGQYLDEDFVITFEDGNTYSKTGYLSYSATSSSRVDLVEMSDLKIRVHGGTAVVIGLYHERGEDNGEAYDYRERFTDVWMKKRGKWLMIASHYAVPFKP